MKALLMLGITMLMQKTDVPPDPQIIYGVYQDESCETPAENEDGDPLTFVLAENGLVTGQQTDMYCRQIRALPGYYADPAVIFLPAGQQVRVIPESLPLTYRLKIMEGEEERNGEITVLQTDGTPAGEPFVPEAGKEYVLREEDPPEGYLSEDIKIAFPLYPQEEPEFVLERKRCGKLKITSDVPGMVSFYRDEECRDEIGGVLADTFHVRIGEEEEEIRLLPGEYRCRISCEDETYYQAEALPAVIETDKVTEIDFVHQPVDVKFLCTGISDPENVKLSFQSGEEEMTVIPSAKETTVRLKRNRTYQVHAAEVPGGVFPFPDLKVVCPEHVPDEASVHTLAFIPFTVEVSAVDGESGRRLNDAVLQIGDAQWHMKDSLNPLKDGRKMVFHAGQQIEIQADPVDGMYVKPQVFKGRIAETGSPEDNVVRFEIPCIPYSRVEIDAGTDSPFVCGIYTDRECTKAARALDGSSLDEINGKTGISFDLRNGTYWLKEKKAPAGYCLNEEVIGFTAGHEKKTVGLPHRKLICRIIVADQKTEKPVSGIRMKITDEKGRQVREFTSGSDPAGMIVEGLDGNSTYILSMKEENRRYMPGSVRVVMQLLEKEQVFRYEVIPCYQLAFVCEGASGKEITDAAMSVFADEKCTEIVKDAEDIHEIYLPEGIYYVRLSRIPEIYYQDEKVQKAELKKDTCLKTRLMPVTFRVRAEASGNRLTDVRFRVTDGNGRIIAEWSGDQGEYPLYEGKPAVLERNREYVVTQADVRGQYICRRREMNCHTELHAPDRTPVVRFENEHYASVFIRETGSDRGIKGVRCTLYPDEALSREAYDVYGNRMSAETDENGTVCWHAESGTFWLKEEPAEPVFYPGRPLCINVDASADDRIIIHREPVRASFAVNVVDKSGSALPGAGFSICDEEDREVFSFVSGSSEQIVSGDQILPGRKYRIHQTAAPEGHSCAETDIIIELPAEAPDHVPSAEIVVPDAVMPAIRHSPRKPAVRAEAEEIRRPYMIPVSAAGLFCMFLIFTFIRRRKKEITADTEKINDFD